MAWIRNIDPRTTPSPPANLPENRPRDRACHQIEIREAVYSGNRQDPDGAASLLVLLSAFEKRSVGKLMMGGKSPVWLLTPKERTSPGSAQAPDLTRMEL
jgi:hypothetical protein